MSPTPQSKLQLNTMATIDKERTEVKKGLLNSSAGSLNCYYRRKGIKLHLYKTN
jgi:hypothetical protein